MAELILCSEETFRILTPVGGSVDFDKVVPFLKMAQTIYLQDKVGTNLLVKVKELTESGDIDLPGNAHYKVLRDEYMTPILAFAAAGDFIKRHAIEITNLGVFRNSPENAFLPEMSEVATYAQDMADKASYMVSRMNDYIIYRATEFPEFYNNSNGNVYPRYGAKRTPWAL
jgi:hypothetical protein